MFIVNPTTINGNKSYVGFKSCSMDEITVITGGYIITPRKEIIVIDETEEHCNVFSTYINIYLEKDLSQIYDISTAIRILCELGCCVYSGIRYREYVDRKSENYNDDAITLFFPENIKNITSYQKEVCKKIINSNKSLLGDREKIYMAYESYPNKTYTKEQILNILTEPLVKELDAQILELKTLKLEPIDYDKKEHLSFLQNLMLSKDIHYLWNLADVNLSNNKNGNNYILINDQLENIGYISFSEPTDAFYGNTVSLYYAIDEKYRGKQYGKIAVEEITDWLFLEKGIDCVIAQADVGNVHSINTLLKAGMTKINEDEEYTTFIQQKNR